MRADDSNDVDVPVHHDFTGSSWVAGGDWWPDEERLVLTFDGGHRHQYFGVTDTIWQELIHAGSAGHYINQSLNRLRHGPL